MCDSYLRVRGFAGLRAIDMAFVLGKLSVHLEECRRYSAFSASRDVLARDLWPGKVAIMSKERDLSTDTLFSAKMVPIDAEEMTEWMSVDLQPELSQAFVYIRSDVVGVDSFGGPPEGLELVVRLQGVISEVNLNVNGDWDG